MIFLSLGAGVQSSVMLMRAIHGDIEKPDRVIFADTGFEPRAVYRHVEWCKKQCQKFDIPFEIVRAKYNMREDFHRMESGEKYNFHSRPPFFMIGDSQGMGVAMRQCTRDAKIKPIERAQIRAMGYKTARTAKDGEAVVMIGISTDEARRAHPSQTRWVDRIYPLIDPLKMSRVDCQKWWEDHYPHVNLPSSSCTICPYRTDKMWLRMKDEAPEDWEEAVDYDRRFRTAYLNAKNAKGDHKPQQVYIHRSFQPLEEVDFGEAQTELDLEDEIYCAGGCGL